MARIAPLITIAGIALAGCGSSSSQPEAKHRPLAAAMITVPISGFAFHPEQLTVRSESRLTFVNRDATAHTATTSAGPAKFDTGTLKPHQMQTVTLTRPGTYTYYCQFHAFMRATITVTG
jgi:plastocyanin